MRRRERIRACSRSGGMVKKRAQFMKTIRDKYVASNGWLTFSASNVINYGKAIRVKYTNGKQYEIPLPYILTWGCELLTKASRRCSKLRILRTRRVTDSSAISIALNDGLKFQIAWDTVLMFCEPTYEHSGGLTKQFRGLIKSNWQKFRHLIKRS